MCARCCDALPASEMRHDRQAQIEDNASASGRIATSRRWPAPVEPDCRVMIQAPNPGGRIMRYGLRRCLGRVLINRAPLGMSADTPKAAQERTCADFAFGPQADMGIHGGYWSPPFLMPSRNFAIGPGV